MVNWEKVLTQEKVVWGKLLIARQKPGIIRGYRINSIPDSVKIIFPEDLPGNRWLHIYQSKLPVLADQLLHWSTQGIALAYSEDFETLSWARNMVTPVIAPLPERDWKQSSEVMDRQTYSRKNHESLESNLQNLTYSATLDSQIVDTFAPNEVWAYYHQEKLYVQVFGPWPFLFTENATRVLGIPDESLHFQVPKSQAPSSLMSSYLIVASLYAGIIAVNSRSPVRFLIDEDFIQAWPCRTPSLHVDVSLEYDTTGQIKNFNLHARMDNGFKGPFASELTTRFLYSLVQMLPLSNFWLEAWSLETHSEPRFPSFTWPEAAASLILNRIRMAIAQRIAPEDFDPAVTFIHPFNEIESKIDSEMFWRRWWAIDKAHRSKKTVKKFGSGLGVGFHNSGFIEASLTSCSIRVALIPREKTLELELPLPLSPEIIDSVKAMTSMVGDYQIQPKSWFNATSLDPGPALLGRSYEIIPKLIFHAYKNLIKKKKTNRARIVQSSIYRRPKSKLWDKVKLVGQPFLSSFPYLIYTRVQWNSLSKTFHLLNLVVAVDGVLIENLFEVHKILHRNLWHILKWLSIDIELDGADIKLIQGNTLKSERKSLQGLLWTALPSAILQACQMACPEWHPGFIKEE